MRRRRKRKEKRKRRRRWRRRREGDGRHAGYVKQLSGMIYSGRNSGSKENNSKQEIPIPPWFFR